MKTIMYDVLQLLQEQRAYRG